MQKSAAAAEYFFVPHDFAASGLCDTETRTSVLSDVAGLEKILGPNLLEKFTQ